MLFLSHLDLNDYSLHVPDAFLKKFSPSVEKLSFNPFQNDEHLAVKINSCRSSVRFSLHEALTPSFLVKAFHSNVIARASENSPAADAHYIIAPLRNTSPIFQGKKYLSIRTADCLAVVFVFENAEYFIGAIAHAGWKGLTQGIIQNTIERLIVEANALGISKSNLLNELHIHIAPAIFGVSYECGSDVATAFQQHFSSLTSKYNNAISYLDLYNLLTNIQQDPSLLDVVQSNLFKNQHSILIPGKIFPDLQLLAALEGYISGIPSENIEILRENTYSHPCLFSYREASHKKTNASHRQWTHLCFPSI
ncbi:polyphenol oxidase family protein [Pigmentibacter sp. JX0631]|uniref:polyphenol oxidase family protein n=1 Tax=Pigmentibacter sp. JX0631 TaxID=2976982 RepID=UPI002468CB7C|nr:polyphenol oxidase family protein [Pigmentibacter sp. JX0631]WGL58807.1 polyphenol oxidase family protein [Pigmentibacter sp. JX0631]